MNRQTRRRWRRLAVGNNKGGTGKTTAVVNLAAALAELGYRVLVVDMDPQANATRRLGVTADNPAKPIVTTTEIVQAGRHGIAVEGIVPCGWPAPYRDLVSVIPARYDLENRVPEAGVLGAHRRLATAMADVDDDYDITLIDLPPSLGHLTQLGLAAAERVLCTLAPEYDPVQGGTRFRDFIEMNSQALNPGVGLEVIGYYVGNVRYVGRQMVGAHRFQIDGLGAAFGEHRIMTPYIPQQAAVNDAAELAVPLRLLESDPATDSAERFKQLGEWLIGAVA